jgi:hypothetical protein
VKDWRMCEDKKELMHEIEIIVSEVRDKVS